MSITFWVQIRQAPDNHRRSSCPRPTTFLDFTDPATLLPIAVVIDLAIIWGH